ncbi:hypothetical protein Hypma_000412 [Hypsizygus marmoreus]|uniref:Uncharacterized protein n=1 Tax=Hypsizygus marmoreus TaxID=39966 RepID=A0A369JCM3_HYPMA|nr:hypothetical protein Hypma_000412 [Hypsizygus marmoreus]
MLTHTFQLVPPPPFPSSIRTTMRASFSPLSYVLFLDIQLAWWRAAPFSYHLRQGPEPVARLPTSPSISILFHIARRHGE